MINESAVTKHFKRAWKGGRIVVERAKNGDGGPGGYLITDLNIALRVPPNLRLFNDRAMFPELPPVDKTYTYGECYGFQDSGPQIERLIIDTLKNEDLNGLKISPWQHGDAVLLHHGHKYTFLNRKFLDLLDGTYSAYGTAKPGALVMFTPGELTADQVFAVMAPMRIRFDEGGKFPNIPELIETS